MTVKVFDWLYRLRAKLVSLHSKEDGESSMTTNVLLVAGAALVLILVVAFGKTALTQIEKWFTEWFKLGGTPGG